MGATETGKLLIVIEDRTIKRRLNNALYDFENQIKTMRINQLLLTKNKYKPILLIIEANILRESGLNVITTIKNTYPSIKVVIVACHKKRDIIFKVTSNDWGRGNDFNIKFIELEELNEVIKDILRTESDRQIVEDVLEDMSFAIGCSREIKRIYDIVEKVAQKDVKILIEGESGTGKEIISNIIHRISPRRNGPFVKINCSALPENLIESELFGYQKGAFSGANRQKKGKFEMADEGTLLLDEIGDMSLWAQAKTLRVLQDGYFERLGENRLRKSDFRLISSTNKDLGSEIQKGNFREDLFYRINVVSIKLPPLRKRLEDIECLTKFFVNKFCIKHNLSPKSIDPSLIEVFRKYQWPGNIRELKNTIESLVLLSGGKTITKSDLPSRFFNCRFSAKKTADFENFPITLKELEKRHIYNVLKSVGKNKKKAAEILGISLKTLYNKIDRYGLSSLFINILFLIPHIPKLVFMF